ncbi:glycoside hydrolase family 140 protein [Niabella yanshanensis]|uniref:Glycoside hydrolase family 140 protein n=1 Tax=Niabella yanshanensis TaxID=577386 RepID=A0ABZ0W470_9BACT|nr:glycoside hydrolase family 140 protein [Niabella yanshanensis]WQD36881.1 glycoside hydrolase family 140 protein [Niabella yanshanensis]
MQSLLNCGNKMIIFVVALLLCYGSLFSQIAVSPSKTYLTKNNQPFFWLADTGWELFHRLSREEAIYYLNVRQQQGFNVIMAVALAELDGIRTPNYYGDLPFSDLKTLTWAETRGNNPKDSIAYDYWDHVDFVIREAAKRNIFIGLLPTWGDKVVPGAAGPVIFTDSLSSCNYARKLANRYKNQKNIIWILGGDRPAVDNRNGKEIRDYRPIWRAMAKAIQDVYGKRVFIAYHPNWFSGEYFGKDDDWLSITAMQSGHGSREIKVWDWVRWGLKMTPKRPFMDMEPCYEDHPVSPWDGKWTRSSRGYFTDYDVRARIYRGIFAGGCGAVYGHHQIWQFVDTNRNKPVFTGDTLIGWKQAMVAKGAVQMGHLKKLVSLHADFEREEDSLLIASDRGHDYKDIIIATRSKNRSYAMVYLPRAESIKINLDRLNEGPKKITWFNPVNGSKSILPGRYQNGIATLRPPDATQKDWVLIVDTYK